MSKTKKKTAVTKIVDTDSRSISYFENRRQMWFFIFALVAFFSTFFLLSLRFTGPTYLSDEIGYLSKSIFLSGHSIDGASSWYGGYSLVIAPLFRFFTEPSNIWTGITIINAALFSLSLLLLFVLLRMVFTTRKYSEVMLVVIVCAFYPALAVMTGYAFSYPLFLVLFVASLVLLSKSKLDTNKYLTLSSVTVGFLYWIHPSAMAPVIVSVLLMLLLLVCKKNVNYLYQILILIGVPLMYAIVVDPWLSAAMTQAGLTTVRHYAETLPSPERFIEPDFIKRWFAMMSGQVSYAVVVTFGLFSIGIFSVFDSLKFRSFSLRNLLKNITLDPSSLLLIYITLSILLIIIITSSVFANLQGVIGVHYWIYGRYVDHFIVPILAILLLGSSYKLKHIVLSILVVVASSIALTRLFNAGTTNLNDNNLINIQAYWPHTIIQATNIGLWLLLSVSGMFVFWILYRWNKTTMIIIVPIYVICTVSQFAWHTKLQETYSKPSSLQRFVRDNYPSEECIGVNYDSEQVVGANRNTYLDQRYRLYSYYLYDYEYARRSLSDWVKNCNAPYLTFDLDQRIINEQPVDGEYLEVIGREIPSGMFLVAKTSPDKNSLSKYSEDEGFIYDNKLEYAITAALMKDYTEVGSFHDSVLSTTNKEGYLLFGPGMPLEKGVYSLNIKLSNFDVNDRLDLDVVTNLGKETYMKATVKNGLTKFRFELNKDVLDLEIRLRTNSSSVFDFKGYDISRIN